MSRDIKCWCLRHINSSLQISTVGGKVPRRYMYILQAYLINTVHELYISIQLAQVFKQHEYALQDSMRNCPTEFRKVRHVARYRQACFRKRLHLIYRSKTSCTLYCICRPHKNKAEIVRFQAILQNPSSSSGREVVHIAICLLMSCWICHR